MPMIDGYDVDGEFREDVTWACYCTDCQVMLDAFERDTHKCETFCTICEEQSNKRKPSTMLTVAQMTAMIWTHSLC